LVSSSESFLKVLKFVYCSHLCLEMFENECALGPCAFYYAK